MAAVPKEFWDAEAEQMAQALLPLVNGAAENGATNGVDQLGVDVDMTLVNTDVTAWARTYTYDLVKGITDTSAAFLEEAIDTWIASGQPLPALIDALTSAFGPVRAEMIAETEVTRAFAAGNQLVWQASGVVDGMRWMTVNDELVCEICGPLDGTELPLDSSDIPPAHPRCRCYTQPIVNLP